MANGWLLVLVAALVADPLGVQATGTCDCTTLSDAISNVNSMSSTVGNLQEQVQCQLQNVGTHLGNEAQQVTRMGDDVQAIKTDVASVKAALEEVKTNTAARPSCEVDVQGYGAIESGATVHGHVNLNGVKVWESGWYSPVTNRRGVNIITVNPATCSVLVSHQYDTHGSTDASNQLATYVNALAPGTVVVGVSADSMRHRMNDAATNALRALGADISDVQRRGAFAFVAEKGFPSKTVMRKVLTEAASVTNQPRVKVVITGTSLSIANISPP